MNEYQIQALVTSIVQQMPSPHPVPFDKQFWDIKKVAEYLNLSPNYVRENYCCDPDFPKPYRIKQGKLLYKAVDVYRWVEGWKRN